jgi:hypothetical protein
MAARSDNKSPRPQKIRMVFSSSAATSVPVERESIYASAAIIGFLHESGSIARNWPHEM